MTHDKDRVDYFAYHDKEEEIVGLMVIKSDPVYGFEIMGAVVDSKYRGRGIGRKLIEYGIDLAGKQGFGAVDIAVYADNKTMLKLVIDLDFIPVRMEHRIRADGADGVRLKYFF
jgi:ribosomal protein S18 acetylase RimI-like enzyme